MDAETATIPAQMIDPPAYVWQARSKRRKASTRSKPRRNAPPASTRRQTALFIGAIVLLTGDDGTEYQCQIYNKTPEGDWLCHWID